MDNFICGTKSVKPGSQPPVTKQRYYFLIQDLHLDNIMLQQILARPQTHLYEYPLKRQALVDLPSGYNWSVHPVLDLPIEQPISINQALAFSITDADPDLPWLLLSLEK